MNPLRFFGQSLFFKLKLNFNFNALKTRLRELSLKLGFPILAILLFSTSCKQQNTAQDETAESTTTNTEPISFNLESKNWTDGNCERTPRSCLKIDFKYPVASKGKAGVADEINAHIEDYLISSLEMEDSEVELTTLEQAAQRFIKVYREEKENMGDGSTPWAVELDGKYAVHKNVLVIRLLSYTNTGGAHPNTYQSFTNFNLNTGEELYYEDFVVDSIALQKLVEKRFYATRKAMDAEMEKEDAFWGKPFYLPENFAVTKKGIKFFYNNYEALPYALGHTEFTIGYKELEGIFKIPE